MMKKIVDISGYGHSGKTAISDYLKDFEDVFSFPNNVEFELFRIQGGLMDLYYSIYVHWNLIRSRVRIHEFKKLVHRLGLVQDKRKISTLWNASGHGYNQYFNDRFIEISEKFIDELIIIKQVSFWPYDKFSDSKWKLFYEKVYVKVFKKIILKELYYTDRTIFLKLVSKYIHDLFKEANSENKPFVLLNNAFEPYNPSACTSMIENSYSIIVDRDPRDIFASLITSQNIFLPDFEKKAHIDEIKKKMIGFDDINKFITRIKIQKSNIINQDTSMVLRIRYEDFILDHGKISKKIKEHIGLNNLKMNQNIVFNPDNSKKNIGIWKKYRDMPEIKLIEKELAEYCYQK